ncbi:hypothetical protein Droror1_Dr00017841 [Drosera rotundifolia]
MARSRRKYKNSRPKVRVGLPKKNPRIVKPAFVVPPKLQSLIDDDPSGVKWDDTGSVIVNYKSFGVVSNPNLLGVRSRTSHIVECGSLQVTTTTTTTAEDSVTVDEFVDIDSGSVLEEDDLKSAVGKKRSDGKSVLPQPLTAMQRLQIRRLVEKYGDDYESMFLDIKLNTMQHSLAALQKLCLRYHIWKDKNPLILVVCEREALLISCAVTTTQ